MSEWSGRRLAALLATRAEHYPVSFAYERYYLPAGGWWSSQREHMTVWMGEIAGAGAYGRKSRGSTARQAYNRFQCAPGLLWLAEAVGVPEGAVRAAAGAAGGRGRPSTQCAAIRRIIPWQMIEERLEVIENERRRTNKVHPRRSIVCRD